MLAEDLAVDSRSHTGKKTCVFLQARIMEESYSQQAVRECAEGGSRRRAQRQLFVAGPASRTAGVAHVLSGLPGAGDNLAPRSPPRRAPVSPRDHAHRDAVGWWSDDDEVAAKLPSVDEREERVLQKELRRYSLDDTDIAALTQIIEEEEAMSEAVAGCRKRVPEPVARLVPIPDVLRRRVLRSKKSAQITFDLWFSAECDRLVIGDDGARLSKQLGDEGEWALFFIALVHRSNAGGAEPVGMAVMFNAIACAPFSIARFFLSCAR